VHFGAEANLVFRLREAIPDPILKIAPVKARPRPPWWLVAAAVGSVFAAAHAIAVWIYLFVAMPVHEDVRMMYVAAEAGLRYGWSTIYDQRTLRALSTSFPAGQRTINDLYTYVHPPLVAWLFAPLTAFGEPVAYLLWTAVSLVALVLAWQIAAPYAAGLAKGSLLLLAVGLWPVLSAFYYGQPVMLVVACAAGSWWLVKHDRPMAAGIALALATFLKPQVIWLLPVAILVSGRPRVVAGWAVGCGLLGALSAIAMGPSGLASWVHALEAGQTDPAHTVNTLIHFFGIGPLTVALWLILGAAALAIAYRQRQDVDAVFAVGLLGTALVAFHFHELDYSVLVLAAWFFLRTSPPLWQRLWLIPGALSMELVGLGMVLGPGWDVPSHAAAIVWCASWLAILAGNSFASRQPVLWLKGLGEGAAP
jgi:glycosyl transferase family 87